MSTSPSFRLCVSKLALKIAGKPNVDTGKFACTNRTHFEPNKGYAVIQATDVGDPRALQITKEPGSTLPAWFAVKKVGGHDEWTRFDPSKGVAIGKQTLAVHATPPSKIGLLPDRFFPNMMRIDKQFGIEYWKSFVSQS